MFLYGEYTDIRRHIDMESNNNDNHNKETNYYDDLLQKYMKQNYEMALSFKKQGYDIFYDVISPSLDIRFYFIAIKEGRKPIYLENIDIKGFIADDCEHPEKAYKNIENFFYSGLFPELLYKDINHTFFSTKTKLSNNNKNNLCPIFVGEVYEDTKNVLAHISNNIHSDKNLYAIGEETSGMSQVYKACIDDFPHKFRGEAGVGKTYNLCYAAAKYAANNKNKRVLIVTYTISLTNKIHHLLDSLPFKYTYNQIVVSHYHNIFKPRGKGEEKFCYKSDRKDEFDLVLVDECQNLKNNYCLKNLMALAKNNNVLYFGDIKQDCYGYNERAIDIDKKTEAATPVAGRWNEIKSKKLYRMNERLSDIAALFAGEIISGSMMISNGYSVEYKKLQKDAYQQCFSDVLNIIKTMSDAARKNTAILFTGSINDFVACNNMINKAGYSTISTFKQEKIYERQRPNYDRPYKLAFNPYSKKVKISTVKSFQGMEQNYIILIIRDEKDFWTIRYIQQLQEQRKIYLS